ncbi:toxin-antitoxin system YwqK family antitoxin [Neisseriaceae bacterium ESL0693]|nr:toxin-antitoxin system YwqK family antitoxin [Neisseriaceae bacterium ESL0693]
MFLVRPSGWFLAGSMAMLAALCWQIQSHHYSCDENEESATAYTITQFPPLQLLKVAGHHGHAHAFYALVKTKANDQYTSPDESIPINQVIPLSGQEGEVTLWYTDRQKKMQGNYHNGQPDGQWRIWYPNGQLAMETYWRNGVPEGKAIHWYENGQKRGELNFVDGKGEGRWQRWHNNGQLSQDMMVHEGEVQTLTSWDKDGRLIADIAIQDHKQNGVVLSWYPSGTKKSESIFRQDELIKKTEWDEDGNIINLENDDH